MIRFANFQFLYLTALIPLLLVFIYISFKLKRSALERFASSELIKKLALNTSRQKQIFKSVILVIALSSLIIAIARPQIGTKLENVQREGLDIIVAIDVSESMLAEDITPNRLEKAKHEIANFIDKLEGDRIGIVAFAGEAFTQAPLTLDYGTAKMFLSIINTDLIPTPGTAIGQAIKKGIESFKTDIKNNRVMILITDGEDHSGEALKFAEEAEKEGIIIYTVGIGSSEGVPIPEYDAMGNKAGFKKDRNGEVVITKIDEVTLEKIALQTNGKYYRASPGEDELDRIFNTISGMEKSTLESREFTQFEDRFQYFLGLAIFLIILELLLSDRKKVRIEWRGRFE
ncbi:VWA domain-containing protein [candidate division KSB1 bacterium]